MAISLQKGQRISLEKNGSSLQRLCIGVNWGAISKKGFFGGTKKEAVDLDASVGIFDANGTLLDVVYFGSLTSKCQSVKHSGDDLTGDMDGDDNLDNEVISIDLAKINPDATTIGFLLNSFKGQDFKDIPFASIRIYEGTPTNVESVFATFDLANDASFAGKVTMMMGKLYKEDNEWKFHSIGKATTDQKLESALQSFAGSYL